MDLHGNVLVTCKRSCCDCGRAPANICNHTNLCPGGFTNRMDGNVSSEPFVKVYDIRTFRSLSPISYQPAPFLLKFLPNFSDTLVVLSQTGSFRMVEAQGGPADMNFFQVPLAMFATHRT